MFIDLKLKNLDDEYKNIVKDSLKAVTILVVINMFMFLANPKEHVLLDVFNGKIQTITIKLF